MSRLFNVEVFNQVCGGDAASPPTYRTGPQFYALLGSAEDLTMQYIVDAAGSLTATVTFQFECSNTQEQEGSLWVATGSSKTVVVATQAALPSSVIERYSVTSALAAYGRVKISSDKSAVSVRIIACGWGH